ncbi:MAG: hypothetical protein N2558_03545 [Patescibacteria group bacterium]|nr:hypothetical protein [Patescibacteria group bacterium]
MERPININDLELIRQYLARLFVLTISESFRYSPKLISAQIQAINALIDLIESRPDFINPELLKELQIRAIQFKDNQDSDKSTEL